MTDDSSKPEGSGLINTLEEYLKPYWLITLYAVIVMGLAYTTRETSGVYEPKEPIEKATEIVTQALAEYDTKTMPTSDDYFKIEKGMHEAEVRLLMGKPKLFRHDYLRPNILPENPDKYQFEYVYKLEDGSFWLIEFDDGVRKKGPVDIKAWQNKYFYASDMSEKEIRWLLTLKELLKKGNELDNHEIKRAREGKGGVLPESKAFNQTIEKHLENRPERLTRVREEGRELVNDRSDIYIEPHLVD